MGVLNFLTGTAGYTAILAAFGLAVAAHFFAPRTWSAMAWVIAFGVLGAAFVGQRELTAAERVAHADTKAAHAKTKAENAEAWRHQAELANDVLVKQRAADAAYLAAAQESDVRHTKELSDAIAENRRLAARPATVRVRYRGAETCTYPGQAETGQGGAARLGDAEGQGIEVTGEARRAFFDLRAEILTDRQALKALTDWIELELAR